MEIVEFFIISGFINVSLLHAILVLSTFTILKKVNLFFHSLLIACSSGLVISITPFLSLLSLGVIPFSTAYLLIVCKIFLYATIFCFLCFLGLHYVGKVSIKPKMEEKKKNTAVFPYLSLSFILSCLIFIVNYNLVDSYHIHIELNLGTQSFILILLTSVIYTIARTFEHIYVDRLMIKRKVSYLQITIRFLIIHIAYSSIIYIMIKNLFMHTTFAMPFMAIGSSVLLFIITINYMENQLIYQHGLLKNKNLKLKISEQRYRSLFLYNPHAVMSIDLKGNLISVNPSVNPLTGYSKEELLKMNIMTLLAEGEKEKIKILIPELLNGANTTFETYIQKKNQQEVHLSVTVLQIKVNKELTGFYIIAQDITERTKARERIHFLAYHDELTGLLNRRGMYEEIDKLIESHTIFSLLLIDVDLFKNVNDHLGHIAGDTILIEITKRLKHTISSSGFIARIGGDEFLICLIHDHDSNTVTKNIIAIQQAMKTSFYIENTYKDMTLSLGVSQFPQDGNDVNTLIKHADMAMYDAKKSGRNNYSIYFPSLEHDNLYKIMIYEELKKSIELHQFQLYYQPKYATKSSEIIGVETLIHWHHPKLGFVTPDDFIPIAEETGLIIPLGNWIVEEACKQYAEWLREYQVDFHLSINISPKQFIEDNFVSLLFERIHSEQIPASKLDLEITESLALVNTELTRNKIMDLKNAGIQITMDDFGTGYTSLTSLSKFSMDRFKIDRSYISELPSNESDAAIVQSLLSVARNLNITVTAEGVETQDQVDILTKWGCNEMQGYYFSRPIPADQFIQHWKESSN